MDRPAVAFETARNLMVDGQVRPNKVSDPRIISAMRVLPRERFVPLALAPLAYSDADIPLGNGRVLLEPMSIGRLVQLAAVANGERVLVVGAGSGYGAALLAACGGKVTALEEDPALLVLARNALAGIADVTPVAGKLAEAWSPGAPYDLVFIDGGFEEIPAALASQLRMHSGRLVGVRVLPGRVGQAVLAEALPSGLSPRPMFDCAAPVLPGMRRAVGFVF